MSALRYIAFTDAKQLTAKVDAINADYLAAMAQKLGRRPGETIDSVIDREGNIVGPADRIITTGLVAARVFDGVEGGLLAVDEATLAREAVDPRHVEDAKPVAELDAKWIAEVAKLDAADAVAVAVDPPDEKPADDAKLADAMAALAATIRPTGDRDG